MKKKIGWLVGLMVTVLLCSMSIVKAETQIPALTGPPVVDQADRLTTQEEAAITHASINLANKFRGTTVYVYVVPDVLPKDLPAFSRKVFDAWKLRETDVLFVLTIFKEGKEYKGVIRMDPGSKIAELLTKDKVDAIRGTMENEYLYKGRLGDGFIFGIKAVQGELQGDKTKSTVSTTFVVLLFGGILVLIVLVVVGVVAKRRREAALEAEAKEEVRTAANDLADEMNLLLDQAGTQDSLAATLAEADQAQLAREIKISSSAEINLLVQKILKLANTIDSQTVSESAKQLAILTAEVDKVKKAFKQVSRRLQGETVTTISPTATPRPFPEVTGGGEHNIRRPVSPSIRGREYEPTSVRRDSEEPVVIREESVTVMPIIIGGGEEHPHHHRGPSDREHDDPPRGWGVGRRGYVHEEPAETRDERQSETPFSVGRSEDRDERQGSPFTLGSADAEEGRDERQGSAFSLGSVEPEKDERQGESFSLPDPEPEPERGAESTSDPDPEPADDPPSDPDPTE